MQSTHNTVHAIYLGISGTVEYLGGDDMLFIAQYGDAVEGSCTLRIDDEDLFYCW